MLQKVSKIIQFHYLVSPFYLPNRNELKAYIFRLFKSKGREIDHINYIFCTDDYLYDLNVKHLNHKTYTDIITFDLSTDKTALVADIYISIDRVRENATAFKTTFTSELHRVIFHGALHLCGYKDKTEKDSSIMRSMEEKCLSDYFVPCGTNRKRVQ